MVSVVRRCTRPLLTFRRLIRRGRRGQARRPLSRNLLVCGVSFLQDAASELLYHDDRRPAGASVPHGRTAASAGVDVGQHPRADRGAGSSCNAAA